MFPRPFGKYVLEREIAQGGMARVLLATLRGAGGFEKRLVVKQIRAELATDEAFVRRFVAEAKTSVELSHANIVPVYELGVEQGVYFLAMELCDGVTLAELLRATGPLSPAEGAYVGVEIARALDYAHRKAGVVHRDVTPRNVMIDDEGAVRLIDFGIAARAHAEREEVFGSPGHMPPEQIEGRPLGPTTDVFAVAALLVEAWSGRAPFRRKTEGESERALREPVPPPSFVDTALAPLDEIIGAALALDPAARPSSAEQLAKPLRKFLGDRDLADVARSLGARVRRVRESRDDHAAAPAASTRPLVEDASPSPDGATRTFAARRELSTFTRPLPDSADGPATRPLPEDGGISSTGRKPAPRPAPALWLGAALGLAGLLAGLALSRRPPSAAPLPAPIASLPAPIASLPAPIASLSPPIAPLSPPIAPLPTPIAPLPASSASLSPPIAPLTAPTAPLPAAAAPLASPTPSASPSAHVRFTALPSASLELDGRPHPLGDAVLPPGPHAVRFVNAALGDAVAQSFRVAPGDQLTVVADFTSAAPRISIRR